MTVAHEPSMDEAWAIQIFSTTDPAGFGPARSMLEVSLLGEHQHVAESGDGLHSYLIVETRDDEALMRSVRLAIETVGVGVRLDQVHGSNSAPHARRSRTDPRAA